MTLTIDDVKVGDVVRFLPNEHFTAPIYFGATVKITYIRRGEVDGEIVDPGRSPTHEGSRLEYLNFPPGRFERVVLSQADLLFT